MSAARVRNIVIPASPAPYPGAPVTALKLAHVVDGAAHGSLERAAV